MSALLTEEGLRTALAACLDIAKQALERLPAEREIAARQRNPQLRAYSEGLIDGTEEALANVLRPLFDAVAQPVSGGTR